MIHRSPTQAAFIAAMIHRLSGIALAVFLPLHFFALGRALSGADALDGFLAITRHPLVKAAELGLVVALSIHLALGLRIMLIEILAMREKTVGAIALSFAFACGTGLLFLLNSFH